MQQLTILQPATSLKTVRMEAAELVATVVRKVIFQRTVINPETWTLLSAATARKLDTTAKSAPSLETVSLMTSTPYIVLLLTHTFQGPKSNVPTVRSMDIPKSVARSHPKIRKLLQTRTLAMQMNNQLKLMATPTIATPTMRVATAATAAVEAVGNSFAKSSNPERPDFHDNFAFYSDYS